VTIASQGVVDPKPTDTSGRIRASKSHPPNLVDLQASGDRPNLSVYVDIEAIGKVIQPPAVAAPLSAVNGIPSGNGEAKGNGSEVLRNALVAAPGGEELCNFRRTAVFLRSVFGAKGKE
jgi:hypothetical protein